MDGACEGDAVGPDVGTAVGCAEGVAVGPDVGDADGVFVGTEVGSAVGAALLGLALGANVGAEVGASLGCAVGLSVGTAVGAGVGQVLHKTGQTTLTTPNEGKAVAQSDTDKRLHPMPSIDVAEQNVDGTRVGEAEGACVGLPDGEDVGDPVGIAVGACEQASLYGSASIQSVIVGNPLTGILRVSTQSCRHVWGHVDRIAGA